VKAHLNGESHALLRVGEDPATLQLGPGMVLAPATLSLHDLIRLREASGHPVLLVESGRLAGVCGETEILQALVRGLRSPSTDEGVLDGAPAQVSAAN